MSQGPPTFDLPKDWRELVKPYSKADTRKAAWQMLNTIPTYFGLMYLMFLSLDVSYWLTMLLAIPAGGLLVRVFIFSHDCGHGSFLPTKRGNTIVGYLTGVLSFTPFVQWRRGHARHHASGGSLAEEHRGVGYLDIRTVAEYEAGTPRDRLLFRIYRFPLVTFIFGPLYLFLLEYRFPQRGGDRRDAMSVLRTNIGMLALYIPLGLIFGFWNLLLVMVPIAFVSNIIGVWMFYVQHHFEGTYFEQAENWDFATAALLGSSFYKLPRVLQWFTGNIGFHHIHHLCPKVANYHLEDCHNGVPLFQKLTTVTFSESLKTVGYHLWDEELRRFVSFREVAARSRAGAAMPEAEA